MYCFAVSAQSGQARRRASQNIPDAVFCDRQEQKSPDGYYNIERMVKAVARLGEVAT